MSEPSNSNLTPQIPIEWVDVLTGLVGNKWENIEDAEIDFLEIKDDILPTILGLALKYKSYKLTKKCLDFFSQKSNIIILIDHFRKARFIYHTEDGLSLPQIDDQIITPIVDIFQKYIGVSPKSHQICLNLSKEEDWSRLETFIVNHAYQINELIIGGDESLNDERLVYITEMCKNLTYLDITGLHGITENGISALKSLRNLKALRISCCLEFESLIFESIDYLDVLELTNVIYIEYLELKNLLSLRRLEIVGSPNLEELSIINCQSLEEIFINGCPKLEITQKSSHFPNLKFLSVNNKKQFTNEES